MRTKAALLPAANLRELVAGLALAGLPHGFNLSHETVALFYLMLAYRYLAIDRPSLLPGRLPLLLITLAAGLAVWVQAVGIFGKSAGSSLLLVGSGLKLLELKNRRDLYVIVAVSYLLALTQFLFDQAIPMAVYLFAVVVMLTAIVIGLHSGLPAFPLARRLRHSVLLILQALPLTALLFVVAPRLPGPMWNLPQDKINTTGLSDKLEPGSINELSLSDELAFRVDFAGPPPPQNQLYWRGPVFWTTDGLHWEMRHLPMQAGLPSAFGGKAVDYTLVLEPHGQKWLLALDMPRQYPSDSHLTGDLQLLAKDAINERRLVRLRSFLEYRFDEISAYHRRLGLQLPPNPSPRLRQMVDEWRTGKTDAEVVRQALAYFHDNDFHYTLRPPLLPDRPVERFLLETRSGFCEHYATSFVVLMRLAGIPSRVVTGYQGGRWNSVGNFLEVRQSDAHAWAEVWLENKGWLRVDPTAAVAPERVERAADFLEGTEGFQGNQSLFQASQELIPWLTTARFIWSNVNHGWHRWILGYDYKARERLLQGLGFGNWPNALAWFCAGLVLAAAPFLIRAWLENRRFSPDPVAFCYQRFCSKLEALGFPRHGNEGPEAYAARISPCLPHLAGQISGIVMLYTRLRYGKASVAKFLPLLRQRVRRFK